MPEGEEGPHRPSEVPEMGLVPVIGLIKNGLKRPIGKKWVW